MEDSQSYLDIMLEGVDKGVAGTGEFIFFDLLKIDNTDKCGINFKEAAKIVGRDSTLTSRVIGAANKNNSSSDYTDLEKSISMLGFDNLNKLVIKHVFSSLTDKTQFVYRSDEGKVLYTTKGLWAQNLINGISNRAIYNTLYDSSGTKESNEMYLMGLLSNIGIICEEKFFLKEFSVALYLLEGNLGLADVERDVFDGLNHEDFGYALACKYNFSDNLKTLIKYHHHDDLFLEIPDKLNENSKLGEYHAINRLSEGYCNLICSFKEYKGLGFPHVDKKFYNTGFSKLKSDLFINDAMHTSIIHKIQNDLNDFNLSGLIGDKSKEL